MVVYGFDSTLPVTVEMMVAHGAVVTRATARALVVDDLPFGAYQVLPEQAFWNAARIMALTGCAAVKLEGGSDIAETARFLVRRGLRSWAVSGLCRNPSMRPAGSRCRAAAKSQAGRVVADATAIAEAGAFAIVIEGTVEKVVRAITERCWCRPSASARRPPATATPGDDDVRASSPSSPRASSSATPNWRR